MTTLLYNYMSYFRVLLSQIKEYYFCCLLSETVIPGHQHLQSICCEPFITISVGLLQELISFSFFQHFLSFLLIYLHTKQWGNSKQLYEGTASGQAGLQIDCIPPTTAVWPLSCDFTGVELGFGLVHRLRFWFWETIYKKSQKKEGLKCFLCIDLCGMWKRDFFSFIFRADTFSAITITWIHGIGQNILNMESHRIDHHLTEIQFLAERGIFIWGEHSH